MSDKSTIRMIRTYKDTAPAVMLFTSLFQAPRVNFHDSEFVEYDIERSGEEIAIVIQDLSAGYRANANDLYTNKRIKPPIFKEKGTLNAFDLLSREAGDNPFQNTGFQVKAAVRTMKLFKKMEKKIRRSIELQASQILQTGTVTLTDSAGTALFTVDYKPKATHFPTAGTAWGAGGDNPLADLEALAEVIRNDGLSDSNELYFGDDAYEAFISDPIVVARLNNRRLNIGSIGPLRTSGNNGRNFRGKIDIGNYQFDMFTYGNRYTDPQTLLKTKYLDPAKVIMMSDDTRLDATFGGIPRFAQPESRALRYLPNRVSDRNSRLDLFTNAWLSDDGENLTVGLGARPLLIPTAIDTYGCIDTGA